jgi:hypothetical protein
LSYRDLEELLVERGIEVDHVTLFRWVQRFTPLLIDGDGVPAWWSATGSTPGGPSPDAMEPVSPDV